MKHFGLIGKNITHSISNQLHQEIARHNGLELTYEHFDVVEDEIEALINDLKKGKCSKCGWGEINPSSGNCPL